MVLLKNPYFPEMVRESTAHLETTVTFHVTLTSLGLYRHDLMLALSKWSDPVNIH